MPSAPPAHVRKCLRGYRADRILVFFKYLSVVCLIAIQFAWIVAPAQADNTDVDQDKLTKLKAAYLYNLLKFTQWPDDVFSDKTEPIRVLIIGRTPVTEVFGSAVKGRQAQDRDIQTDHLDYPPFLSENNDELDDERAQAIRDFRGRLRGSHMVFCVEGTDNQHNEILSILKGTSVLTVSDIERFANTGGMVGLALNENKRLGFVVNLDIVEAGDLKLSSSLLKLAEVIRDSKSSARPVKSVMLAVLRGALGSTMSRTDPGWGS